MSFRSPVLLAALVVGPITLLAADPGTAGAALPGRNGLVLFQSQRTHSEQLTTITATGGSEKPVPHDQAGDADPAWNPTGSRVAFDRNADIWVEAADGTGQVDLTPRFGNSAHPTWSPDGKTLAFSHFTNGTTELWTVDVASHRRRQLTHDHSTDEQPAWSTRGQIAYRSYQVADVSQIFVINANGTGKKDLSNNTTASDVDPDWAPNGTTLIFTRSGGPQHCGGSVGPDLWTMSATGTSQKAFCHHARYSDGQDPAVSPDSQRVVFTANNGTGGLQLWIAPFPGGGTDTKLTRDPGNPTNSQPSWQPLPTH